MTLQPSIDVRPNDAPATLGVGDPPLNSDDAWQRRFLPSALRLLKAADQALHSNRIEAQRCIAELTSLLVSAHAPVHAHPNVPAAPAVRGGLAPWQLKRVTEFVTAKIEQPIRLRDLAGVARLSTGYFSQAFRCSTGQSPYAYVLRRRIEHAQVLMLGTDTPLSEIALDCGLTDQPHFTRLFRKIVGVPPATWRRLKRDGPSADGEAHALLLG